MKSSKDNTKTPAPVLPGYLLFLLAALACAPLRSPAQVILNAFPCPDQGTLPEGCPLRPYNITMELSSGAATAWSVTSGPAWFTRQSNTATSAVFGTGAANIPVGDAGNTFPIGISATVGGLPVSATFSLTVRTPGVTCPAGFSVQPCQREIVYVLDKSGSMNWDADPGDGLPTTRWQKLKEVVESQLLTLDDLSLSLGLADSFDVVLFGGDIHRVSVGDFFNVPPDIDDVIPPATVVSGGTPLGGGIQMALKRSFNGLGRPGGGKKRLIFMVSDGDQNMNPMVNAATFSSVACEAGGFPANGVTLTDDVEPLLPVIPPLGAEVLDLNSAVNAPIERYNVGIGIGMTGAAHDLMNGAGDKYESTLGVADLDVLMDAMMTGTYLAATSPRVLDSRRGIAGDKDNPTIERFYVNDSVQHLTVKFFTLNQPFSDVHVDVLKDGFPVYPKLTARDFLRLLHINFENPYWAGTNSGSLSPSGWWEFRIYDKRQTAYRVTAFVEDKRIHQSLELGSGGKFYAGDPLPLRFQLHYRDDGIAGAKARAFLYRPGDDLGDLAADAATLKDLPVAEPGGTAAQAKIDHLVQQTDFYNKLQEEERVIDLDDQGDGSYTGTFTGNVVTGGYRVMVRVEGEHAVGGKYQGWSMEGFFTDFARPGDIDLNESVSTGVRDGNTQAYTLVIKPTNQLGKNSARGRAAASG
ncbi:MAG: VWA domain-containing protein [Saprospirales bacterium]|nr:VWA domain-containing protein [Saprospirales bacterium]